MNNGTQSNAAGQSIGNPKVIAVGEHTMATASEAITIVGLHADDVVVVSVLSQDTTGAGVLTAVASADTLTIASSEATTGDGVAAYIVTRP